MRLVRLALPARHVPSAGSSGGATPELSKNKGFTEVIRAGVGTYCLALPGFDPSTSSWFATVDYNLTGLPDGNGSAMVLSSICPTTHPVGVRTERIGPATGIVCSPTLSPST